jgi:hypothetical protein
MEAVALLEQRGYAILDRLFSENECRAIDAALNAVKLSSTGTRNLLDAPWCAELACELRARLRDWLPASVAVQCTLFEKSQEKNWLVAPHQDLGIPVLERIEYPELSGWSEKEGVLYVQPPAGVLEQVLAVRLHIDNCMAENGPLKVIAGSHRFGKLSEEKAMEIKTAQETEECCLHRGGALLMRPLLLHASSKSTGQGRRRVLHFVYGPPSLPFGLTWQRAV